jgi:hypothetical protein
VELAHGFATLSLQKKKKNRRSLPFHLHVQGPPWILGLSGLLHAYAFGPCNNAGIVPAEIETNLFVVSALNSK